MTDDLDTNETETDTVTYRYDKIPDEVWDIIEQEYMYDRDIVSAYMENNHLTIEVTEEDHVAIDVDLEDVMKGIDDSYQGRYGSDADFAESLAEDMGLIPREYEWPQSYIDWVRAARDLMMDYWEINGCYFRS